MSNLANDEISFQSGRIDRMKSLQRIFVLMSFRLVEIEFEMNRRDVIEGERDRDEMKSFLVPESHFKVHIGI